MIVDILKDLVMIAVFLLILAWFVGRNSTGCPYCGGLVRKKDVFCPNCRRYVRQKGE